MVIVVKVIENSKVNIHIVIPIDAFILFSTFLNLVYLTRPTIEIVSPTIAIKQVNRLIIASISEAFASLFLNSTYLTLSLTLTTIHL